MNSNKSNNFMKLMTVLLLGCAVIITGAFAFTATGLAAKYLTNAGGSDAGRTAKFSITQTGELIEHEVSASIIPGTPEERELQIANNSEVAVSYQIHVTNKTQNLMPMQMTLWNGSTEVAASEGSTAFDRLFVIDNAPKNSTDTLTLRLNIPATEDSVEPDPNLAYMGMADRLTITVTAVQID